MRRLHRAVVRGCEDSVGFGIGRLQHALALGAKTGGDKGRATKGRSQCSRNVGKVLEGTHIKDNATCQWHRDRRRQLGKSNMS